MLGFDTDACIGSRAGAIRYNSATTCAEFCNGSDWICTSEAVASPSPPTGCTSPGDTCDDGSVFAGLSPDGHVPMYTTPADAASTYSWNDGTGNYTDMSMANCTDGSPGTASSCQTGEANTALLAGLSGSGSPAPYNAAEYCDGLSAHGYDDWYLPAQDELDVLHTNKNVGDLNGTFGESSYPTSWYWSSSEDDYDLARIQILSFVFQGGNSKDDEIAVRCVRK